MFGFLKTDLLGRAPPVPAAKTYHEKTKKMINHQTSYDQPDIIVRKRTKVVTEPLGPPVATFQFRYRPLGILQAQDIAPPPPQPASPSPQRDIPSRVPQKRT
ncbi:hypothetical protein PM082_022614 [Marasmius tenuissimus]|nr:hypothetical protein PM082_022614 [Marasmius tenuissimus]